MPGWPPSPTYSILSTRPKKSESALGSKLFDHRRKRVLRATHMTAGIPPFLWRMGRFRSRLLRKTSKRYLVLSLTSRKLLRKLKIRDISI